LCSNRFKFGDFVVGCWLHLYVATDNPHISGTISDVCESKIWHNEYLAGRDGYVIEKSVALFTAASERDAYINV
jgi:hypothetical protein